MTEPNPDAPEEPGTTLDQSEGTDEEELGTDPLEGGIEPAEGWSPVAADPPTEREQRERGSVDEYLAQERPDTPNEPVEDRPIAERREHELDESVDQDAEQQAGDER
ncbi:hypothetical protein [Saccharopolyspora sp. CA-218241]|uniref:hypothetical protein n=1 Tax=Saccharopolyspora sp. CA-218241 TaxID=3240027 RepID=UPI003D952A68